LLTKLKIVWKNDKRGQLIDMLSELDGLKDVPNLIAMVCGRN
jgi:hypothetical protein